MKLSQAYSLLAVLLLPCLCSPSWAVEDDPTKIQALTLAQQKFAETFIQKGEIVVTKYTRVIPFGHPSDWSLYVYKEVSPSASIDTLSETDKMNGITWRGSVRFEAKFERIFMGLEYPDHEKYDGLHPNDWSQASNIFDVQLEQRNGKWTVQPSHGHSDFSRPTANDLHELEATLQKLSTTAPSGAVNK